MSYKILNQSFFQNKDTIKIAKSLLGKFLVRRYRGKIKAYLITEVEVYDGFQDRASHAYRGETERNKIMFGEAGRWYIYFTYGMHWLLNIITGPKNYPAAILIRGAAGINGPAKLTKALHIDKKLKGKPALPPSALWIEDRGMIIQLKNIKSAPRIGVDYAGPIWRKKKLRFYINKKTAT